MNYELRYYSTMIAGMALYGEYSSKEKANEAAWKLTASIKASNLDNREKAQICKSIQIN